MAARLGQMDVQPISSKKAWSTVGEDVI